MHKIWNPPSYKLEKVEGELHKLRFTVSCSLRNFFETGTDFNKKKAKREAALKVYRAIFENEVDNVRRSIESFKTD